MNRVIVHRPVNGAILCEKCMWADQCKTLEPRKKFTPAVGTNFRISEPIVLVDDIRIPEYTMV